MNGRIRPFNPLDAPYIKIDAEVTQPGVTNGKPNIKIESKYVVCPSAKKISTYIINQIFGSELVTQSEGLSISWLMPTLKQALELAIYQQESFIYLHKFDNKVYLECIKKSDIWDLVQKFDKVVEAKIKTDIAGKDSVFMLERHIKLKDGKTFLTFTAYEKSKQMSEYREIPIKLFNAKTGSDFESKYILDYECLINIDLGMDFFKDSKKLLIEEMKVLNVLADEVQKTRTRIATSQHYQTTDIVANWKPSTYYQAETISIGDLKDYFTLLPGDKDHQFFEFLQGTVRVDEYEKAFKFYDYQVIQLAGLSPASFGYEKDAYMNTANIDLSKNASDMTVEAIKTQIEPQINKLFENVVKLQNSQNINENLLPNDFNWDYGSNEKFDDMKKIQVLRSIQGVGAIPYSYKAKVILPILNKLIDDTYSNDNKQAIEELISAYYKDNDIDEIKFGEV